MSRFQEFNFRLFNKTGNFFDTSPVIIFVARLMGSAFVGIFVVTLAQDIILLVFLPFTKSEEHALMIAWIIITIVSLFFLKIPKK